MHLCRIRQVINNYSLKFIVNTSEYMVLKMQFPERLARLRKEKGYTQKSLAEEIRVTKSQIYRYEKGDSQPTLNVIQDLAVALRVSANELVFGDKGRKLPEDLHHQFEAVSKMSKEDQRTIESLIEGMIIKYRTREIVGDIRR